MKAPSISASQLRSEVIGRYAPIVVDVRRRPAFLAAERHAPRHGTYRRGQVDDPLLRPEPGQLRGAEHRELFRGPLEARRSYGTLLGAISFVLWESGFCAAATLDLRMRSIVPWSL